MSQNGYANEDRLERDISADIAIVAIAGRFPGANTVEQFWQNLTAGVESITQFSDEELQAAGVPAIWLRDPHYVKANPVLENIDQFDAAFFDINPREAEILDPQQRLFLECAWEALEQAGYDSHRYPGLIGVYGGVGLNGYLLHHLAQRPDVVEAVGGYQVALDNDKDFLPSRVAYKLNLTGAAVNIQTACSTSLVAVHLGCQSLLNGEMDMVLCGGASIRIPHYTGYLYTEGMILAPDGHCRAFDAQARGTIDGSGAAIVVLKRLEDAIADGDHCYAVIRGSAINNDGALKVGYTAPSIDGQAAVIAEALAVADVDADTIQYVEAHGTGTELGDPIEVTALSRAYAKQAEGPLPPKSCAIGSVKTNMGHLDTAAGTAGLIKTALALKHRLLPPSLNFDAPNPKIDFDHSPFYVNTQLQDWPSNGAPRRAGVSSFGIGGTNAHVILEESPVLEPSGPSRPWQLMPFSAKTSSALAHITQNLAQYLEPQPRANLADVAFTLSCGRRQFDHRAVAVCRDIPQAIQVLRSKASSASDDLATLTQAVVMKPPSVVFLFPGQGSQYVNMGRELYEQEPHFQQQIDCCAKYLEPLLQLDLRTILYPVAGDEDTAAAQLRQTAIAQPALFTIEYALAQLWQFWGVEAKAMVGHSIGEYVAACLAGVFSLEEGLALVAKRGQLMQSLPSGAMLAVPLAADALWAMLADDPQFVAELSIAAVNQPNRCVVSGPEAAIAAFQQHCQAQDIETRPLHTSHAFHSVMMEPILASFRQCCQRICLMPPTRPYLSNLTGTWIATEQATDPDYWTQHLRHTVQFADSITQLCADSNDSQLWLEVGPGQTLTTLTRQNPASHGDAFVVSMRHPKTQQSDVAILLSALGQLWLNGITIDWFAVYADQQRHRIPLPTYPFERQRYWIDPPTAALLSTPSLTPLPSQKSALENWFYLPSWQRRSLPLSAPSATVDLPPSAANACILAFESDTPALQPLIQQLGRSPGWASEATVIRVRSGPNFQQLSDQHYYLNPQRREDYDQLVQSLQQVHQLPQKVVHLWTLTQDSAVASVLPMALDDPLGREGLERSQYLGFYSLLFFAQAWSQYILTQTCDVVVLTHQLYSVTGDERIMPTHATLLGPIQVISQENPSITCRCVDIGVVDDTISLPVRLVDQLIAEVKATVEDRAIAYRGTHRWVQQFEPYPLTKADDPGQTIQNQISHAATPQGVYLITGGLSYVGYQLAEYLAKTVQGRLVLTGRSQWPPRSEWATVLDSTDPAQSRTRDQIQRVQALEALGAEVLVLQADVSDRVQMATVLDQIQTQWGGLNGVIHAAGAGAIWGETINLIESLTPAECQRQFQTKVHGTMVLGDLLKDYDLDFCVLTSSLSAILGGLGFASYTAVNAFMDSYVQRYNQLYDRHWLSINWDGWQGGQGIVWGDRAFGNELEALEITADEGVEVFDRILSQGIDRLTDQIVISTIPLMPRIDWWLKRGQRRGARSSDDQDPTPTAAVNRDHLPPYVAPQHEKEVAIATIFQSLLGVSPVGIHDSFLALGGDSLTGTQLLAKLRQRFAVDLPMETVFNAPTVAQLAEAIQTRERSPLALTDHDLDRLDNVLDNLDDLDDLDDDPSIVLSES